MSSDLSEIIERLNYCKAELATAKAGVQAFFNSHLEIDEIVTPAFKTIRLRITSDLPPDVVIRTGSIVHEARASLDALACCLATRNGNTTKSVYFPISKNGAVFALDGMSKIKKLSAADQQTIVALKPYGGGDDLLFGFHEFDRTRKHVRLNAAISRMRGLQIRRPSNFNIIRTAPITTLTNDWQPLCVVSLDTDAELEFPTQVEFAEPEQLKGSEIIEGVGKFISRVGEIVNLFALP